MTDALGQAAMIFVSERQALRRAPRASGRFWFCPARPRISAGRASHLGGSAGLGNWRGSGLRIETGVVNVAFLPFRNKRVATSATAGDSTVGEDVILGSVYALTREHRLNPLKHFCRDEWLVVACKGLPSFVDPYQADVEGILENCNQAVDSDRSAVAVSQTTSEHLLGQVGQ